jgi:hypothetical protein
MLQSTSCSRRKSKQLFVEQGQHKLQHIVSTIVSDIYIYIYIYIYRLSSPLNHTHTPDNPIYISRMPQKGRTALDLALAKDQKEAATVLLVHGLGGGGSAACVVS